MIVCQVFLEVDMYFHVFGINLDERKFTVFLSPFFEFLDDGYDELCVGNFGCIVPADLQSQRKNRRKEWNPKTKVIPLPFYTNYHLLHPNRNVIPVGGYNFDEFSHHAEGNEREYLLQINLFQYVAVALRQRIHQRFIFHYDFYDGNG